MLAGRRAAARPRGRSGSPAGDPALGGAPGSRRRHLGRVRLRRRRDHRGARARGTLTREAGRRRADTPRGAGPRVPGVRAMPADPAGARLDAEGRRPMSDRPLGGVLLLATLTLLWGGNWPAMKLALRELDPWTFRTVCLLVGGGGLLALARASGQSLRVPRRERWPLRRGRLLQHHGVAPLLGLRAHAVQAGRASDHRLHDAALDRGLRTPPGRRADHPSPAGRPRPRARRHGRARRPRGPHSLGTLRPARS